MTLTDRIEAASEPTPYGDAINAPDELEALDNGEMIEGYRDGLKNEPEPKGNRSRSYWHGWRNGMVDGGHAKKDAAQALLAAAMKARG